MDNLYLILSLVIAWILDKCLGDPTWLPHPVVGFGKLISWGEKHFNCGIYRKRNGAILSLSLIIGTFIFCVFVLKVLDVVAGEWAVFIASVAGIFYCLAGTTLSREVRWVFKAADRSLEEGRRQVARIVGRETSGLSVQEVRTAALETLAENLSDGVIAPLFWYMLLGIEGMLAYKMINTLDSMIGYRNERYKDFGYFAARIDDIANYIPARLTALLMLFASGKWKLTSFVKRYGKEHASPNSGYPEAALAGILNCRFGGPHNYFGETVWKPFIGNNERLLTTHDMQKAIRINQRAEILMIGFVLIIQMTYIFI